MALRLFEANARLQVQAETAEDFYYNAPCGYHSLDRNGRILLINDTELRWLGYAREELVGKVKFVDLVAPAWVEAFRETFPEGEEPKTIANLDLRLSRKDGTTFPVLVSRNWIRDERGEIVMSRSTLIDNSLQKEAEARVESLLREKDLILREVHHRVKNNMNSITSLLGIKAEGCKDSCTRAVITEAISQVESMGFMYDRLYRSGLRGEVDLVDYLPGLVGEMLKIFGRGDSIRIGMSIAKARLDAGRLSSLGIIINELITNSVKYAFDGTADPSISVKLDVAGGKLALTYEDNGRGMPPSFASDESEGFGMTLMEGLARQLGGDIRAERSSGARFVLEFPL
jgi:PAS domain S-box-containing protein